jgi:hypothetical protein
MAGKKRQKGGLRAPLPQAGWPLARTVSDAATATT